LTGGNDADRVRSPARVRQAKETVPESRFRPKRVKSLHERLWTNSARGWVKIATLLALLSGLPTSPAFGQKSASPKPPAVPTVSQTLPAEEPPHDRLGRDTPYGAVTGFLKASAQGNWERASEFLESKQAPVKKQELARQLKLVMDRGLTVDLQTLSKIPEGTHQDIHAFARESVGWARVGAQNVEISLDRVLQTNSPPYWLFSAETLTKIPELAQSLKAPWFEEYLPKSLMANQILEIPLFFWVVFPFVLCIVFGFVWLVTWLLGVLAVGILRLFGMKDVVLARASFLGPLRLLIFGYLVNICGSYGQTLAGRQIWRSAAIAATIMGFTWLATRMLDLADELTRARFKRTQSLHKVAALQLSLWTIKGIIVVTGLVVILSLEGINPTTVITGLGLGGIAIAFAAQKTIENIFGTVMLVADQPLRVGDWCKVGDTKGKVEEIGLRSTRIRTRERTLVTVPNGQLASMIVENFATREKLSFNHILHLSVNTSADQLRFFLAEIRRILQEHPAVQPTTASVRFIGFGASSLDIEILAYVLVNQSPAFLAVQEELLLRMMDVIKGCGPIIAPSPSINQGALDLALDTNKSPAAIEEDGKPQAKK
jgi:MscS family membrane protein